MQKSFSYPHCKSSCLWRKQKIIYILKTGQKSGDTHVLHRVKKAYDRVPLSKLWLAMSENGMSDLYIKAVKNIYIDTTSNIKVDGKLSEDFQITKALRHGCPIAPTLFKIHINKPMIASL